MTTAIAIFAFLFALLAIAGVASIALVFRFKPDIVLRLLGLDILMINEKDLADGEEILPPKLITVQVALKKLVRKSEFEKFREDVEDFKLKAVTMEEPEGDSDQEGTKPTQITEPQARITTELIQEFVGIMEPLLGTVAEIARERLEYSAQQYDTQITQAGSAADPFKQSLDLAQLALQKLTPPTEELKQRMISESQEGTTKNTREWRRAKADAIVEFEELEIEYNEAQKRVDEARSNFEQFQANQNVPQLQQAATDCRAKAKTMANLRARFDQFRKKLQSLS